jgi:hypothetical protein
MFIQSIQQTGCLKFPEFRVTRNDLCFLSNPKGGGKTVSVSNGMHALEPGRFKRHPQIRVHDPNWKLFGSWAYPGNLGKSLIAVFSWAGRQIVYGMACCK